MTQAQTINPYIEYFSRLLDTKQTPTQLSGFANCLFLAQIVSKIRQFPTPKMQLNPSTFAQIFTNLKELYKKIQQFWNQQLDKQLQCQEIDLVEIAHHFNPKEIAKLLNLLIQTLILSSEREYFINKILQTSSTTQHHFMAIVESTLEKRKTLSPRKQRQQRIYDKMIELDHENENLQNVITELCRQKQQLETNLKKAQEKITKKQAQIQKLNQTLLDYAQTPIKKRDANFFDTNEKNAEFTEKLKQKIIQMTKQHEKQILTCKQQIDYLGQRAQLANQLQNQLQIYKVKVQANKQAIEQYGQLSRKFAESKLNLIQKQEMANQCLRKLNSKSTKLQQLEQKLVQKQLQLQRKNVQIQQLSQVSLRNSYQNLQDFPNLSSLSLHRTLSQHCPQVANSQAQFLYDSNKKLREQLQRATSTIRQRDIQLQKLRKQYEKRQSYEIQNKKLLNIIDQISQQTDQQKTLILGCLHQLRLKTLNELAPRQRARRQEIKTNLKIDNTRLIMRANKKMQV